MRRGEFPPIIRSPAASGFQPDGNVLRFSKLGASPATSPSVPPKRYGIRRNDGIEFEFPNDSGRNSDGNDFTEIKRRLLQLPLISP